MSILQVAPDNNVLFFDFLAPAPKPSTPIDPCYPSPCGPNARCRSENGFATCECLPEYQGNPYESCRPECLISSDCAMNKACIRNKCQDPCPGTCGLSAICSVSNHIPICYCPEGTTGDAFRICEPIPRGNLELILKRGDHFSKYSFLNNFSADCSIKSLLSIAMRAQHSLPRFQ